MRSDNGVVNPKEIRTWIDGETFIVMAQRADGREGIEVDMDIGKPQSKVQKFFKRSRWRKRLSDYWLKWNPTRIEEQQTSEDQQSRTQDFIGVSEGHSILHPRSVVVSVQGSRFASQAISTHIE
jgi:hypothetical protein